MTCIKCKHGQTKKFGKSGRERIQRYRCTFCSSTFLEPRQKPLGRHYISMEKADRVLTLMLEGMSIRAIARVTGVDKGTILSLLATAGSKARALFDSRVRNMNPKLVQADELWGFCHTKEMHMMEGDPQEWGHSYVWIALDSQTKMVLSYHVGKRTPADAYEFIGDLGNRIQGRFQLTTDGLAAYLKPVEDLLWPRVDYAQLVKVFRTPKNAGPDWYGTGKILECVPTEVMGQPEPKFISTSHIERANLSVRMHLRRFTRLTNGFSKKLENLKHAVALYMAWYCFCRVHQTLRVTPCMEAGLTDHVWSIGELLSVG
jgi:transposase-like protein/IS1 family transposase